MLWSVGARFGFDGTHWPVTKLRFWYEGHVEMVAEEKGAIDAAKEAMNGAR